jgi:hypothetical protein
MSYEELEDHNIFLPESARGDLDLSSSVNQWALAGTFVLGLVGCGMMVYGGGWTLTWIGTVVFFAFMISFTLVSNAGIEYQNQRVEEAKEEEPEGD